MAPVQICACGKKRWMWFTPSGLEIQAGATIEGHVAMMMAAEQTAPLETPAIAGNVEQVFEHAAGDETKVFRRVVGY